MIHLLQRIFIAISIVTIALSAVFSTPVFAASNKLFLTPTSSQLTVGGTISVNVKGYIEASSNIGSVTGTLNYPSALLRVIDTPPGNSAYNSPSISVGANSITFSGTKNPGPVGQVHIFSVTFQAVGAGTARVDFGGNSKLNQVATDLSGAQFSIANPPRPNPPPTPAPTPTPTPAPTPTPTPSPSPSPTPAPNPDEVQPPVDDEDVTTPDMTGLIKNVNRTGYYNKALVSWGLTEANAAAEFVYGESSDNMSIKGAVIKSPDGNLSVSLPNLAPGMRYFFRITAIGAGDKTATYSGTVSTLGYPIGITITQGGQPVVNAKIQIGQQQYATSKDGTSTLMLAAGTYTTTISYGNASKQETIKVEKKAIPENNDPPEKQLYKFELPAAGDEASGGGGMSIFVFIGVMVAGLALITGAFLVFVAIKRRRMESGYGSSYSATTSVIIDDGYNWEKENTSPTPPAPTLPTPPLGAMPPVEPYRHTSVHLDEEEPKDMFELAKEQTASAPHTSSINTDPIAKPLGDWPQNPSSPHSTKP